MDSDQVPINLGDATYEILDFEEEDITVPCSRSKGTSDNRTSVTNASLKQNVDDEGELKSDEDSGLYDNNSSEEGEVQSEIDEIEVPAVQSPVRNETPWERGLRLAREKLEKVKALKASEKDLVEKRMTLPVAAPDVKVDTSRITRDDVFWLYYYKASVVGRTELTCLRFLPEDLQPPSASDLAEWRLGISVNYHDGCRRRRYRRDSSASASSSSFSTSSSRASSIGSASEASSLFSVAASWKATCAHAMKDYLSSPIRNKDRRLDRARSSSISSGSGTESGSSDSGSDRSNRPGAYRTGRSAHGSKTTATREGRARPWDSTKTRSRSETRHSSASRSSSGGSSEAKPGYESWKYGSRKAEGEQEWPESIDTSRSPPGRHRSDVPPLPHERPVKRPWVAAPGLLAGSVTNESQKVPKARSPSQSRASSISPTTATADEKRFITSWSRSPSSGDNEAQPRRPVRRERLPDVVPGTQSPRVRRPITPSSRQRPPGAVEAPVQDPYPPLPPITQPTYGEFPSARQVAAVRPNVNEPIVAPLHERPPAPIRQPALDPVTVVQPSSSAAGELPSNRPGVRITLAPRLKASGVDMTNIPGGVTRPSGVGRTTQQSSPPRLPRLPFPLPSATARVHSPGPPGQFGGFIDQTEIRRQAEAAAAIVEERERRRSAAEAARRRKNPMKKKRDDLSKIPIRGRPTYRRQSFSDSSDGSSASRTGSSPRAESVDSRSPSGTPEPNIILESVYEDPPITTKSRKRHKTDVGPYSTPFDETVPDMVTSYGRQSTRAALLSNDDDTLHPFDRKQRGPPKTQPSDFAVKYRGERQQKPMADYPYRMPVQSYPKHSYADYDLPEDTGPYHSTSSRRRDQPRSITSGHSGMRYAYDEDAVAARYDPGSNRYMDSRRSAANGPPYMHPEPPMHHHQLSESRPAHRASSPHADLSFGDAFGVRAPPPVRTQKLDRKRPAANEFDSYDDQLSMGGRRKRAVIVSPTEPQSGSLGVDLRRARSRHRSRGPGGGAPIDRSEPFESSDTSAAEQRLRELRERLNRVDDAIAEIKAGSSGGGYFGVRH